MMDMQQVMQRETNQIGLITSMEVKAIKRKETLMQRDIIALGEMAMLAKNI